MAIWPWGRCGSGGAKCGNEA
uniref:Uncharacterized protein n=1 Tax=Arundo donax TaxID=35708 RepID=A0A0A9AE91_ARUDO